MVSEYARPTGLEVAVSRGMEIQKGSKQKTSFQQCIHFEK
jgi:hypothetical protein